MVVAPAVTAWLWMDARTPLVWMVLNQIERVASASVGGDVAAEVGVVGLMRACHACGPAERSHEVARVQGGKLGRLAGRKADVGEPPLPAFVHGLL